jgi:AcrR family transcriptional regulator
LAGKVTGVTKRAPYHHGDLREALVGAALEVIAESGVGALSIAEAARRTKVSAAAPYRHFAGRQALLNAAAIRAAHLLADDFRLAAGGAGTPAEKLAATASAYVRFVVAHRAGFDLVFSAELADLPDEERNDAGRAVMDVVLPIALEVAGGDAKAALDLLERQIAAAHGYATLHLTGFLRRRSPAVEDIARQAAEVTRVLIRDLERR